MTTYITNVTELQAMQDNVAEDYVLSNNIDASATATWNGGLGFDPIGEGTTITQYAYPWDDTWAYADYGGNWVTYPIEGYSPELLWNKVDEVTSDGNTTYIQTTADGDWALLSFTGAGLVVPDGATSIVVSILATVRTVASGTSYIQGKVNIDGTEYLIGSSSAVSSQSYAIKTWIMTDYPPVGTGGWTVEQVWALSNAGVGIIVSDATPNVRITQLRIRVTYKMEFSGSLDGNGHTISGLFINRPSTSSIGLFGYTNGATISDVALTDINITGLRNTGGLIGYAYNTTVLDCSTSGAVTTEEHYAGGLLGVVYNSDITDCSSSATVIGSASSTVDGAGGLIGEDYSSGSPSNTFINCYATGNVTGYSMVGGFVGDMWGAGIYTNCYATGSVTSSSNYAAGFGAGAVRLSGLTISRCYALGDIICGGEWGAGGFIADISLVGSISNCYARGGITATTCQAVGGFAGYVSEVTVTNCYSTGVVSGDSDVGGFCGDNYGDATITSCFWDTQTSGTETSDGGTGKTTVLMKRITTFSTVGWDIENSATNRNDGYPFLSWEISESDTIWKIYGGEGWEEFSFPDLFDDHGRRVKNATVKAFTATDHTLAETQTTDDNGTATFSALPTGEDIVFHATWGGVIAPTNEEWFFMRVNDIEDGGTGAGTADGARDNLGVSASSLLWELILGD